MKIYNNRLPKQQSRKTRSRLKACLCVIFAMFSLVGVRLGFLCLSTDRAAAADINSSAALELYTVRKSIYDRNFRPFTSGEADNYICVSPTAQAYTSLSEFLGGASLESALNKLKENKPFVIRSSESITGAGLTNVKADRRYGLASHIIGYVDSDGHGISGIEKDFDKLLYTGSRCLIRYSSDAAGGMLSGIAPQVKQPEISSDGVVLTLDRDIQLVCQSAMETVEAGAAVVTDVNTGDILAMVSHPDFDAENIESYLNDASSPLINRCLTNYNVGSVFKPLIAAAALESGLPEDYTVTCTGSANIGGTVFGCHKKDGHGQMDLQSAIANSCNVFFYNLSSQLSAEKCIELCDKLRFFEITRLSDSIYIPAAGFPSLEDLTAPAAMANLSIGQGDLMLSPAALAGLYGTIARGGEYIAPRLIKGVCADGYTEYPASEPVRVFSKETSDKITSALKAVISGGTGVSAMPDSVSAAGKTATAETGWIKEGQSVNQAWFAGFFPADEPEYCVVILNEGGSSGAADCAPVFKAIADGIVSVKGA